MMECIFEGKVESVIDFEILSVVFRFIELYFYIGRDGWSSEMI